MSERERGTERAKERWRFFRRHRRRCRPLISERATERAHRDSSPAVDIRIPSSPPSPTSPTSSSSPPQSFPFDGVLPRVAGTSMADSRNPTRNSRQLRLPLHLLLILVAAVASAALSFDSQGSSLSLSLSLSLAPCASTNNEMTSFLPSFHFFPTATTTRERQRKIGSSSSNRG